MTTAQLIEMLRKRNPDAMVVALDCTSTPWAFGDVVNVWTGDESETVVQFTTP